MNVEHWLPDICELATQASQLALQRFREGSRHIEKGPGDWASEADLEIEELIRSGLQHIAPGTLVHGDLHYANVLAADREPWLVIDPQPLSGDPRRQTIWTGRQVNESGTGYITGYGGFGPPMPGDTP